MEVAIKWSAAPDMTPQTVLYRRPVAQFSNFQPKIVSSWLILALFQANSSFQVDLACARINWSTRTRFARVNNIAS
jgi:hypothetical protein